MKPKSDGAPDSRNLEGLRLRTEMLLREFWGVPRGVVPQAPAKLAVAKLFPLLVDLGEQALRAVVKRHAEFSFHRAIMKHLLAEHWAGAKRAAVEAATDLAKGGFQSDGLLVRAGESWRRRFTETNGE